MAKNSHFPILHRININQHNYFDFLKYLVKPWVEKTSQRHLCTSKRHTQPKFLKSGAKIFFWHFGTNGFLPPSLPDPNPLDLAKWLVMHKKVKARPRHDQGLPIALHQADMRQNSWVGGEFQQHGSWPLFSGCNLGQMGPNWAMVVFFEISMHEVFIWNFTIFHQIDQKLLRKNDVAIIISHPVQVYGSKAADFAGFMVILVKSNFAALWFMKRLMSRQEQPRLLFLMWRKFLSDDL